MYLIDLPGDNDFLETSSRWSNSTSVNRVRRVYDFDLSATGFLDVTNVSTLDSDTSTCLFIVNPRDSDHALHLKDVRKASCDRSCIS